LKRSEHLNESRVKYLAGDDTLSGRDLYEKDINFRPTHKPLLRTNHKPKIRGMDRGIWRRIHYVPYLVTIGDGEKVEGFRQKKLTPELPCILNWMLLGLKDYLAGGLRPPAVVSNATKEYRHEMDSVGRWIDALASRATSNLRWVA
jgi:putative DNA primase/helicase